MIILRIRIPCKYMYEFIPWSIVEEAVLYTSFQGMQVLLFHFLCYAFILSVYVCGCWATSFCISMYDFCYVDVSVSMMWAAAMHSSNTGIPNQFSFYNFVFSLSVLSFQGLGIAMTLYSLLFKTWLLLSQPIVPP